MKRTYYYSDELNDDFAGTNIKRKELPLNYKYFSRNPVRKFFEFILYRLIVTPLIFLFQKIVFHETIKNRRGLKGYRKGGYFLYANHTAAAGDAFRPPSSLSRKRRISSSTPTAYPSPSRERLWKCWAACPSPPPGEA